MADADRGLPVGLVSGLANTMEMFLTKVLEGTGVEDWGGGVVGLGRKAARALTLRELVALVRGGGLAVVKARRDCFMVSTDGTGVSGSLGINPLVGGELDRLTLLAVGSNERKLNPRDTLAGAFLGVGGVDGVVAGGVLEIGEVPSEG